MTDDDVAHGDTGVAPLGGLSAEAVREALHAMQSADLPVHGGRTLAYVYDSGLAEADALGLEALAMFAGSNGLDPTAFPSLARMENDLVAMAGAFLDAPEGYAGSVTSGGTESILLAVLAARDGATGVPEGMLPSMVLPSTAHAAFLKAAKFFGVRAVVVEVDPVTLKADVAATEAAIDETTVLLVGSAPSYAHGVIDPIPELAAIATAHGIRCHVDACIGGWVLPHLDDVPPWTFEVEGVTSVSVDLHKYAYTPKGVSILLHRTAALRRSHFFASADWPGYTMLNTTMQSTKSGGPLAAAWAVTHRIGAAGYRDLAAQARRATLDLADAVREVDGLRVFAAPSVPDFVMALQEATSVAREAGPVRIDPALAGLVTSLDPSTLDEAGFAALLAAAGLAGEDGGVALPEQMAPINALLDVCPPALREVLLTGVLDLLSRPTRS